MMRDKVEKMIETMDKVVEKTLHLFAPDSLKYMDSDNLEICCEVNARTQSKSK